MLVHLDRSRIDVTGSFAYDLTTDKYLISTRHGDSGWRRRRKLRRKTRLEEKGGNASNMELWCNFPFPSTLCRVIYLSAHQPNLICAILSTAFSLREENKERKKERTSFIDPLDYVSILFSILKFFQNTFIARQIGNRAFKRMADIFEMCSTIGWKGSVGGINPKS